jgi:hypothetical protein
MPKTESVETVLEANPVAAAVEGFLEQAGDWEGTATDLLADLTTRLSKQC